jgi:3-hydroxy-9,10-secoandrosta-1,3,5(10)-triene-9,17-dione monooxygenase reductase component
MSIDSIEFRRAMGQFATGIAIVAGRDTDGRPFGLTVNSFTSVSLEPPLVLFCLANRSELNAPLASTRMYGVSVLAEDQQDWSTRFATPGADRFSGVELAGGPHGLPLVPGALAWLECRVAAIHPGGDHSIYLGEVLHLEARPGRPLLYHGSGYRRLAGG